VRRRDGRTTAHVHGSGREATLRYRADLAGVELAAEALVDRVSDPDDEVPETADDPLVAELNDKIRDLEELGRRLEQVDG
jgi:hypothetical protein